MENCIKMKKIIFLDIDGVLATSEFLHQGQWALATKKQLLFKRILDQTNAEIVLSSSWRCHNVEETKQHMEKHGFMFNDKLIGVTIRAYQWIEKGVHLSIPRGVEIKQWIDTNIHSDNGKNYQRKKLGIDYQYVIIDDDCDMLLEHKDNFVRTDSEKGLTEKDVEKAIEILNNKDLSRTKTYSIEQIEKAIDDYFDKPSRGNIKKVMINNLTK